jgi:hypothetical protein
MRCKCCDTPLPLRTIYRTILVQHTSKSNPPTEVSVEEDLCEICADPANQGQEETNYNLLAELGLTDHKVTHYDRY